MHLEMVDIAGGERIKEDKSVLFFLYVKAEHV